MNLVRIQIYHIPNVKEASKYPLSNNNNAHSITKYGVLGWLDVQIVALRLVHPLKGHRWGTGQKRCPLRARRTNAPPLPNHKICSITFGTPVTGCSGYFGRSLRAPRLSVCTVWALRGHCVHIAHAEARILTQEYLSPVY